MGKQAFSDSEIRKIYEDVEKHLDKTLCHIVQLLDRREQTVATAESCTGGLLSQSITSVAGASRVFELGLCTYANRMKERLLSVPAALLNAYGAVSAPVFRPLIGMDKTEIVETARKIDTFETSTLPYEDCCTVFTPRHPKVRPNLEDVERAQNRFDFEPLLEEAVAQTTLKVFKVEA